MFRISRRTSTNGSSLSVTGCSRRCCTGYLQGLGLRRSQWQSYWLVQSPPSIVPRNPRAAISCRCQIWSRPGTCLLRALGATDNFPLICAHFDIRYSYILLSKWWGYSNMMMAAPQMPPLTCAPDVRQFRSLRPYSSPRSITVFFPIVNFRHPCGHFRGLLTKILYEFLVFFPSWLSVGPIANMGSYSVFLFCVHIYVVIYVEPKFYPHEDLFF